MNFLQKTYHFPLNILKKIKTHYVFNNENESYLKLIDISDDQIDVMRKRFHIGKICPSSNSHNQSEINYQHSYYLQFMRKRFHIGKISSSSNPHNQFEINYQNSYYLKLLRLKSFYCNAKIFQALTSDISDDNLYYDFRRDKSHKIFNEYINVLDIKELEKNIHYLNSFKINCLVLEAALAHDNVEMYNLIESLLPWQREKVSILESMCFVVARYGSKIKNSQLSHKIREHVQVDNFYKYNCQNFYHSYSDYQSHKKHIENINDFFNINILDMIVNKEFSYQEIKNLHLTYAQQQIILKKIPLEKNYNMLLHFLNENKSISMKKKFLWLHNNKLLNNHLWEQLLSSSYIGSIGIVFQNYHILKKLVKSDILKTLINKYKEEICKFSLNFDTTMDFIKKYPFILNKQELSQLISNAYVYYEYRNSLEHDALELINQKYLGQITAPMGNLIQDCKKYDTVLNKTNHSLDSLYKKYSNYFNNEDFLLSVVENSTSDILLSCYLHRYFMNSNNVELKTKIAQKLHIFNSNVLSSDTMYGKTLTWVIENNLLNIVIENDSVENIFFVSKSNNYLVPLLIEQYKIKPDYFLEKSVATDTVNKELFYFILNNYTLSKEENNNVCKQIYIYNEVSLAEELFKIQIVPNEDLVCLMKEFPNCAGNVLLKSHLKEKLEHKKISTLKKDKIKINKI